MERSAHEPISDDELQEAKRYLTGSFPLRLDSNGKIADFIAQAWFYDLGHDYADAYIERVNAVTIADVQRVAQPYLHPDRFIEVVVADLKAARRALTRRATLMPHAPGPVRRSAPSRRARRTVCGLGCAVLVGLAALLAYANSLRNGFVWDDPIILARQLVVFRSAGDVLAPPRDIPQFSPDYYRPLTIASYLLDRAGSAALGAEPLAFHLSVVLAHAATSVLVFLLGLRLLGDGGRACRRARAPRRALRGPSDSHRIGRLGGGPRSDVLATGFCLAALIVHGGRATRGRARRPPAFSSPCARRQGSRRRRSPLLLLRDLLLPPPAKKGKAAAAGVPLRLDPVSLASPSLPPLRPPA